MKIQITQNFLDNTKKIYQNGGVDIEKHTHTGKLLTFKSYAEINKLLGDNFFRNKDDFIYLKGYITAKSGYVPTILINNKLI